MIMQKTYEIETPPSQAILWSDYEQIVTSRWQELLNSEASKNEENLQSFLEIHPCLIPGSQSMSGSSGHSAHLGSVITQPRLAGFDLKIPDFMWIARDSMTTYIVLVELETPHKKWFRKDGVQSSEFSQAQNQLNDWKIWFKDDANKQNFLTHYYANERVENLKIEYVLIIGSRNEFIKLPNASKKRFTLQRENEHYMTFDRLHPNSLASQYMCVKRNRDGYEAVSVPPTLNLGPIWANNRHKISGKERAIQRNPFIPDNRKNFLISRVPYWDNWGAKESRGFMNTGDRE